MNLVCFDVGGTSVKYAVVKEGKILNKSSFVSKDDVAYLLENMVNVVEMYRESFPIDGIGLSMPGAVSSSGIIYGYSALPTIHGPNWKNLLKQRTGLEVSIENDANCAALAEIMYGSGVNYQDAIFLVIGSGVGGAIVKNRKIHHGIHLSGGEFGYMIMEMNQQEPKTFSNLASTVSLVNKVKKLKNNDNLDGLDIFQFAKNGDEICKRCIDEFYYYLSLGIYNLQYAFDPEIVLLSGAVSKQDYFIENINKNILSLIEKVDGADIVPKLALCSAGADANLIGAYVNFVNSQMKN